MYPGVVLTPKISLTKPIQTRNNLANSSIALIWQNLLNLKHISLLIIWNFSTVVCRSTQTYATPVWGLSYFEKADKLRFFSKTHP